MKSEWHEHLEHDEFHLKKWGCTAMGSLTKCDQQAPLKIINYFHKTQSEWNFPKRFLGSLEYMCLSILTKFETWSTFDATRNQHSLLARNVL